MVMFRTSKDTPALAYTPALVCRICLMVVCFCSKSCAARSRATSASRALPVTLQLHLKTLLASAFHSRRSLISFMAWSCCMAMSCTVPRIVCTFFRSVPMDMSTAETDGRDGVDGTHNLAHWNLTEIEQPAHVDSKARKRKAPKRPPLGCIRLLGTGASIHAIAVSREEFSVPLITCEVGMLSALMPRSEFSFPNCVAVACLSTSNLSRGRSEGAPYPSYTELCVSLSQSLSSSHDARSGRGRLRVGLGERRNGVGLGLTGRNGRGLRDLLRCERPSDLVGDGER
eukprot:scaffold266_cov248-Pinguiococcus_pyrenoidosus.AAC.9